MMWFPVSLHIDSFDLPSRCSVPTHRTRTDLSEARFAKSADSCRRVQANANSLQLAMSSSRAIQARSPSRSMFRALHAPGTRSALSLAEEPGQTKAALPVGHFTDLVGLALNVNSLDLENDRLHTVRAAGDR